MAIYNEPVLIRDWMEAVITESGLKPAVNPLTGGACQYDERALRFIGMNPESELPEHRLYIMIVKSAQLRWQEDHPGEKNESITICINDQPVLSMTNYVKYYVMWDFVQEADWKKIKLVKAKIEAKYPAWWPTEILEALMAERSRAARKERDAVAKAKADLRMKLIEAAIKKFWWPPTRKLVLYIINWTESK